MPDFIASFYERESKEFFIIQHWIYPLKPLQYQSHQLSCTNWLPQFSECASGHLFCCSVIEYFCHYQGKSHFSMTHYIVHEKVVFKHIIIKILGAAMLDAINCHVNRMINLSSQSNVRKELTANGQNAYSIPILWDGDD